MILLPVIGMHTFESIAFCRNGNSTSETYSSPFRGDTGHRSRALFRLWTVRWHPFPFIGEKLLRIFGKFLYIWRGINVTYSFFLEIRISFVFHFFNQYRLLSWQCWIIRTDISNDRHNTVFDILLLEIGK